MKRTYLEDRVMRIAAFILNTGATVREAARYEGVSKSTVHKDMVERLPLINETVANDIRKVLDEHLDVRHIRGGEATKAKYTTI